MRTILLLFITSVSFGQCTMLVNGIQKPCDSLTLAQRQIDSVSFATKIIADSIQTSDENFVAAAIKTTVDGAAGKVWSSLTASEVRAILLYDVFKRRKLLNKNGTLKSVIDWK